MMRSLLVLCAVVCALLIAVDGQKAVKGQRKANERSMRGTRSRQTGSYSRSNENKKNDQNDKIKDLQRKFKALVNEVRAQNDKVEKMKKEYQTSQNDKVEKMKKEYQTTQHGLAEFEIKLVFKDSGAKGKILKQELHGNQPVDPKFDRNQTVGFQ